MIASQYWQGANGGIAIRNTAYTDAATFKTAMSGVYLFYELAEPTTEQGTPYSENLIIDDFGSMDFDSDVPQGALIFYPVDYKAFVDTLYKYSDGAPSNIALKSDVASEQSARETQDTILLGNIKGTLRNLVAVKANTSFENTNVIDLGDLNWSKTTVFYVTISDIKPNGSGVCTNFTVSNLGDLQIDYVQIRGNTDVYFRYKSGSPYENMDNTQFKNAMKGVLLAYEKASE